MKRKLIPACALLLLLTPQVALAAKSNMDPAASCALAIFILVMVLGYYIYKIIKLKLDAKDAEERKREREQEIRTDRSGDMPDAEELMSAVRDMFFEMQKGWCEGDLSGLICYFCPTAIERLDRDLKKVYECNAHPFCEHDEPRRVWISRNNGFQFDVSLEVDVASYYLMSNGVPFPNQELHKVPMRYTFTMNKQTKPDVGIKTSCATYRVYHYECCRI